MTPEETHLATGQAGGETHLEPLSPELVLVDPNLARVARAQLAHVGDSLVFPRRLPAASRVGEARTGYDDRDGSRSRRGVAAGGVALQLNGSRSRAAYAATQKADWDEFWRHYEREQSLRRRRRVLALAAFSAVVGAVGAFAFVFAAGSQDGDRSWVEKRPGAAGDRTAREAKASAPRRPPPPAPPSDRLPTVGGKQPAGHAQPKPFPTRVFVWAPVTRASFYKVEFFRRGVKIFVAWPSKTRLELPLRWTYRGRQFRLTRGKYHWRVSPAFGPRSRPRYGNPTTRSTWDAR